MKWILKEWFQRRGGLGGLGRTAEFTAPSSNQNQTALSYTYSTSHLWRRLHFICELTVFWPLQEALFVTIVLHFFPLSTVSVCSPSFGLTPWCYLPMWVFRQVLALKSVPQWSHWDAWLFSSDPSFPEQPFFNNAPSQKPCLTPVKYSTHCSLQPWPKRPF